MQVEAETRKANRKARKQAKRGFVKGTMKSKAALIELLQSSLPFSAMDYRKLFLSDDLYSLYTYTHDNSDAKAIAFLRKGPKPDVSFFCSGGHGIESLISAKLVEFLKRFVSKLDNQALPGYFSFSGLELRWLPFIEKACSKSGMTKAWANPCWMYILPDDVVLAEPITPKGYHIRFLEDTDAEKVNDLWAFKSAYSLPLVRRLIATRPSVGICFGDELVSWILVYDYSAIGMMFTCPDHRRKGLGECCARALLARWPRVKLGFPFCYIVQGNTASEKLYTKLGFLNQGPVVWVGFEPQANF